MSSTKLNADNYNVMLFIKSNRSAIKKRNKIKEIEDSYEMPVLVINLCDSPSKSLIVIFLFFKKLTYLINI